MKTFLYALAAASLTMSPAFAAEPTKVMIVGLFHMSNPGHDIHNIQVDDVLAPSRQAEIAAVNRGLQEFKPTQVDVEWPADLVKERYAKYLAGTLDPSHNEVVQLGFRLAKASGLKQVHGVDVDGDFPFQPVLDYAKAHGQDQVTEQADRYVVDMVQATQSRLTTGSIGDTLRYMNDPAQVAQANAFYRTTLRIGGGAAQPGADLLTAWYQRNFRICANIIQTSRPGDRVVVFYGSGHAFLLRQCIAETPGFELVEPNAYLPSGAAAAGSSAKGTR